MTTGPGPVAAVATTLVGAVGVTAVETEAVAMFEYELRLFAASVARTR